MVVTANLQEASIEKDVEDLSEMKVFVRRLLDRIPYRPDVLLLQEVRRSSARYVARLLTRSTGDQYDVANRLDREPWRSGPNRWVITDTATVINTATTTKRSSGFIRTGNPWGIKDRDHQYKRHAYVSTQERESRSRLALISVHLARAPEKTAATRAKYAGWVDKLATGLEAKYPESARAIGGDFNQTRCYVSDPCRLSPFWEVLTDGAFDYVESLWTVNRTRPSSDERMDLGVDFIFTTARPLAAGADDKKPPDFYSNHRFFWTVIGN